MISTQIGVRQPNPKQTSHDAAQRIAQPLADVFGSMLDHALEDKEGEGRKKKVGPCRGNVVGLGDGPKIQHQQEIRDHLNPKHN